MVETMKKIMVIKDYVQTRNLFLKCLEAEGFYAIGAENGLLGVQSAILQIFNPNLCASYEC